MQKYNIHTAKEKKVNSNYFTGKVVIREILGEGNSEQQEMYHVTFYNGALTTLHYHGSDQILVSTKGKGVVGLIKGTSTTKSEVDNNNLIFLEEGDTVCIPAYKLHFHGAIEGEDFSHIAIMKMYRTDKEKDLSKRAVTKWEYDLIRQEITNKDEHSEEVIKNIEKEIEGRIQMAISEKYKRMTTRKGLLEDD